MVNLGLTRGGAGFYRGTSGGLPRGGTGPIEGRRRAFQAKVPSPEGSPCSPFSGGSGWAGLKGQDKAQGRDPVLPCP